LPVSCIYSRNDKFTEVAVDVDVRGTVVEVEEELVVEGSGVVVHGVVV